MNLAICITPSPRLRFIYKTNFQLFTPEIILPPFWAESTQNGSALLCLLSGCCRVGYFSLFAFLLLWRGRAQAQKDSRCSRYCSSAGKCFGLQSSCKIFLNKRCTNTEEEEQAKKKKQPTLYVTLNGNAGSSPSFLGCVYV